jgi:hypothetical protein
MENNNTIKYKIPCNAYEFDEYIDNMKKQIKNRENFILKKSSTIHKQCETNEYLKQIKNNYDDYILDLLKERKQQKNALENINLYIQKMIIDNKLTDEDLQESKKEYEEIIKEIEKINMDIEKFYNSTK